MLLWTGENRATVRKVTSRSPVRADVARRTAWKEFAKPDPPAADPELPASAAIAALWRSVAGLWRRALHDGRARRLRQQHRRHVAKGELEAYMGPVEWSQLRAVVEALAPRRIVEWGAGGGTRALLEVCASLERYVSIEHDRGWFERVQRAVRDERLSLQHVAPNLPEPERNLQQKAARARYAAWVSRCEQDPEAMRDYVARPAQLIDAADLVLVDGRARCFCIAEGFRLLRPGGVLLLHDAQRSEYRDAVSSLGTPVFLEPWELGQLALIRKPLSAPVAASSVVPFIARSARS
jgi:predicted O-methyltransferase YrrM